MEVMTGLLLHFQTVDKTSQLYLTYTLGFQTALLCISFQKGYQSKIVNK